MLKFENESLCFGRVADIERREDGRIKDVYIELLELDPASVHSRGWHDGGRSKNFPQILQVSRMTQRMWRNLVRFCAPKKTMDDTQPTTHS